MFLFNIFKLKEVLEEYDWSSSQEDALLPTYYLVFLRVQQNLTNQEAYGDQESKLYKLN